ncbi:IDEAL domain-containing protein [Bacillus sp. SCS-151]|uniref:IDEAL domain-containing protein n=1 Tax=Nanhaiella sioensis TaxID=3115293 RepID=UPI003978F82E
MRDYKSYTEIMKSYGNALGYIQELTILDEYIQIIIDEALNNRKKEMLLQEIDEALDARNYNLFMMLSSKYIQLI